MILLNLTKDKKKALRALGVASLSLMLVQPLFSSQSDKMLQERLNTINETYIKKTEDLYEKYKSLNSDLENKSIDNKAFRQLMSENIDQQNKVVEEWEATARPVEKLLKK